MIVRLSMASFSYNPTCLLRLISCALNLAKQLADRSNRSLALVLSKIFEKSLSIVLFCYCGVQMADKNKKEALSVSGSRKQGRYFLILFCRYMSLVQSLGKANISIVSYMKLARNISKKVSIFLFINGLVTFNSASFLTANYLTLLLSFESKSIIV